jgi:hypothetical protein
MWHSKCSTLLAIALTTIPVVSLAAEEKDDDQGAGAFWSRFHGQLSVGAMLGPTRSPDLLSDNNDGSLSGVSTDKIGTGGKVYVDWQPWDYVGFEAAYTDLGKNSFRGTSDGSGYSWLGGSIGTDQEAHGWELSLFTRVPVSERLTLLLRGGAYGWNSTQTYYENGGAIVTEDRSSGTDLTYGVGFEYDVGVKNRFFWRGELQHYTVDEANLDSNALWIGFMYRR